MRTNPTCDIAIAGIGPAGATAAYLLAKQGLKVHVIDKRPFPRPKLCAGLLTWKTVQLINDLFGLSLNQLIDDGIIVHACRNYRIYFNQTEISRGRMRFPFHFVQRSTYDHQWYRMAQQAGANLQTGVAVVNVDPARGRLELSNGQFIDARIIVGADGVWSKVRNAIPHHHPPKKSWRKNLAATIEVHHDYNDTFQKPDFASLYFGIVPWGYGWSFPGSNNHTLGMGTLARKNDRPLRHSFEAIRNPVMQEAQHNDILRGYPLPYGNYLSDPTYQRALLVGDACGLADPLLGEGIYYAHRSAQIAAKAIIDADLQWKAAATLYRNRLKTEILREFNWIKFFRNLLFVGGRHRRYRGLKLFFRLMPRRLEAAVQGQLPYAKLLMPWHKPLGKMHGH